MITRDDLTVEEGRSPWGGPRLVISLPNRLVQADAYPQDRIRTFELQHTQGLDIIPAGGQGRHVTSDGDWHGALHYRHPSGEPAIAEMVEYLNHLAERDRIARATYGALLDLQETLQAFNDSLSFVSRYDHNETWPQVLAAVTAADMVFQGVKRS